MSTTQGIRSRSFTWQDPATLAESAQGLSGLEMMSGIAATLLDSCMGCAVHTTLPAGVGYTTGDLHVRYIRGMSAATGRVLAEGTVVHSGRRTAVAEGRLFSEDGGTSLAHATTSCLILR